MPTLKENVLKGLTSKRKKISPKYLYDDAGSEIFSQIMAVPEYYLTHAEAEILSEQALSIYESLHFSSAFNVVELGAGDGEKTISFLKGIKESTRSFTYIPVDISGMALEKLEQSVKKELPSLHCTPVEGDYFTVLKELTFQNKPNLFLFLGSNIGNYPKEEAVKLLRLFAENLKSEDKLLIGFDLKKNPIVIQKAYDDSQGVTRSFFMNLLTRLNRELDARFELDAFDYYSHYNPENGEVNSYLISLKQQEIEIGALQQVISFYEGEPIWVELSKKYYFEEIETLSQEAGFTLLEHFTDSKNVFSNSLLKKK